MEWAARACRCDRKRDDLRKPQQPLRPQRTMDALRPVAFHFGVLCAHQIPESAVLTSGGRDQFEHHQALLGQCWHRWW